MYIAYLIGDVLHGRLRERAAFVRPALPKSVSDSEQRRFGRTQALTRRQGGVGLVASD